MRSIKLTLSYDGTEYAGWQIQPVAVSIQSCLELAIAKVTGESQRTLASGRTDAGVHAMGQVVRFRTDSSLDCRTLQNAINSYLPEDIRVNAVEEVDSDFHPIRDARSKRYRYKIHNAPWHDVFARRTAWHVRHKLDVDAMREASLLLQGTFDFAAFQATGSERKTTVREVLDVLVEATPVETGQRILIEVEATGFLYNMMRNIVGSLVEVGQGKQPPGWIADVIDSRDRSNAGMTAPAHGLCLLFVCYGPGQGDVETGEAMG